MREFRNIPFYHLWNFFFENHLCFLLKSLVIILHPYFLFEFEYLYVLKAHGGSRSRYMIHNFQQTRLLSLLIIHQNVINQQLAYLDQLEIDRRGNVVKKGTDNHLHSTTKSMNRIPQKKAVGADGVYAQLVLILSLVYS